MSDELMADLEFPTELDPNRIPTFSQLPLGRMEAEIKGWSQEKVATAPRGMPNAPKTEKVVVKVQFSIVNTADNKYLGLPHSETFWIGTDADPMASSPATWIGNAGRVMKLLKKAKVATTKGLKFRNMMDAAVNSHVLLDVTENKKTGRRRVDFLSVAEKPLEYYGDGGAPVAPAAGSPVAPPPAVFDND